MVGCGEDEALVGTVETTTTPQTSGPPPSGVAAPPTTSPATTGAPISTSEDITTTTAATTTTTTTTTMATGSSGSWRQMAPSPLSARTRSVSAWTGTELLIWAGLPDTSDACGNEGGGPLCGAPAVFDGAAYDPVTDTWRTIAESPQPAGGAPTQLIPKGAWTGTELVVWGGWGDPIAAAYDPISNGWRDLPTGPLDAREGHVVVAWGDQVAVLGGQTPFGFAPGPSEPRLDGGLLDPATGTWTPLPDLPSGDPMRAGVVTATVADGRLFVVKLETANAYVLDPGSTAWLDLGSPGVDGYLDPVGVADSQWLFAGGQPPGPDTVAAVLDLTSGQWHEAAAPTGFTMGYLSASAEDMVLAMAARWAHEPDPPLALSWEAATNTWTELPPPPLEHRTGAAVAWTGSELLVWGGASSSGFGGPSFADGAALAVPTKTLLVRPGVTDTNGDHA